MFVHQAFEGNVSKMQSANYAIPLMHVKDWMDSPTEGISASTIQTTDEWLEQMSSITPKPEHMLYQGTPWGGLHVKLNGGKQLAPGCPFNASVVTAATRPWVELIESGTFSEDTLAAVPQSFEVAPQWVALVKASLEKGPPTWLHYLYLGTAELERGNQHPSAVYFAKSIALKPNVHAARALAVSAPDIDTARTHFLEAWEIYKLSEKTKDMVHLGTNLAMELTLWLGYQQMWEDLKNVMEDPALTEEMRSKDRVMHARAMLAIEEKDFKTAQKIILGSCFATYGGDRTKLVEIWETSHYQQKEAELGRSLTYFEKVQVRRHIGCIGDGSFQQSSCNRGPVKKRETFLPRFCSRTLMDCVAPLRRGAQSISALSMR